MNRSRVPAGNPILFNLLIDHQCYLFTVSKIDHPPVDVSTGKRDSISSGGDSSELHAEIISAVASPSGLSHFKPKFIAVYSEIRRLHGQF